MDGNNNWRMGVCRVVGKLVHACPSTNRLLLLASSFPLPRLHKPSGPTKAVMTLMSSQRFSARVYLRRLSDAVRHGKE
jgi:hypothetical protein